MATKMYSHRYPIELIERVSERSGPRGATEFIVAAIEAALDGPKKNSIAGSVKEAVRPRKSGAVVSPARLADQQAILDFIQGKSVSSREAEQHFGWLGIRYSKAERGLLAAGKIQFHEGMLVAR